MSTDSRGSPYRVEPGALTQREDILGIWRGRLSGNRPMESKFDWFYRDSPLGTPLIRLLRHVPDDNLVGVACAGPRRMLWHGVEIRAGVLVDFAVAPGHRSAGPALMLARGVLEEGHSRFDLLYGFPNTHATAITRRAGHTELAGMYRYACVLRYGPYLSRRLPSLLARPLGRFLDWTTQWRRRLRDLLHPHLDIEWTERSDARFDDLWQHSEHGDMLVQVRDTGMLRWRFERNPLDRIRYLVLADPATGTLQAWFAVSADGEVLHVLDFWSTDAVHGIARRYVDALLDAAYRRGHVSLSFEYAGCQQKMNGWCRAGFVLRDKRPVYGSFTVAQAIEESDLHLTAADEDQ